MKPTILIAGAAGATGSVAAKLLLGKGFPVRALVRKDDERSRGLQSLGAEIVVGDLLDFRAVRDAFRGAARAYFVYPMRPGIVDATANFAQAALDAKAEFVLNMSQKTAREDAKSDSAMLHWLAERLMDRSGVAVAHLRPVIFADWFLYMRTMLREGRYSVPFGVTGRFAPIAAEDQAAVIAAILSDPAQHAGQTYPLFGPAEFTPPEIAAIASERLGKPIRYEQITAEQWVHEVTGRDIPFLAQHLTGITYDHQNGMMAGTNDVVQKITGRHPMTLAEFVEKHRAVLL